MTARRKAGLEQDLSLCLALCSAVIPLCSTQLLSQSNELRISSLPGLRS